MCDRYLEGRGLLIFRLISLVDFISRTLEILKAFHGPLQPMPRKGVSVQGQTESAEPVRAQRLSSANQFGMNPSAPSKHPLKLLDRLRQALRSRHYILLNSRGYFHMLLGSTKAACSD